MKDEKGKSFEICVREFIGLKLLREEPTCINMSGEQVIDVFRKDDKVLVVMTEQTYVLDKDFKVLNVIEGQALGGKGSFVSLGKQLYDE